jgi:hypothetical protein
MRRHFATISINNGAGRNPGEELGSKSAFELLLFGTRLLQQDSGGESHQRRQQPLHAPRLDRLEIGQSLNRINDAYCDRCQKASHSGEERDERGHGKAKPFLDVVEFKDLEKLQGVHPAMPDRRFDPWLTGSPAIVAKSGADHKLGLAAITNLDHGRDGNLGLGNRRTPKLLRCVVDNLGHVDLPKPVNRKPVTKIEAR